MTRTSRTTRINLVAVLVAALLVCAVAVGVLVTQRTAPSSAAGQVAVADIAADARVLDAAPDAKVTVTEFLDFECEACAAMYPTVESLRARYSGRVAFTFRYFPLPGHRNSVPAAIAVEAAARQDKLELLYRHLFDTQSEWGETQASQVARFRQAAADLGLDMTRFDQDIADPDVRARVERDVALGRSLGITGTPTFFVNGIPIELQQAGDLEAAIQRALTK